MSGEPGRNTSLGARLPAGLSCLLALSACLALAFPPAWPAASFSDGPSANGAGAIQPRLVVYCFHGEYRCFSCLKLEEFARATLEENFADDLKSGRIVFEVVDLAKPENAHFISEYQLDSWSVVLSVRDGGKEIRFRNLRDLRRHVKDRQSFVNYLFLEIEPLIHGG